MTPEINPERHVMLCGEITSESIENAVEIIEALATETEPIFLTICSGGGDVDSALWLANYIRSLSNYVVGVAGGNCASAALVIYCACDERWSYPGTSFLQHPSICTFQTHTHDQVVASTSRITYLEKCCDDIQRPAFTGMNKKQYEQWALREQFMTLEEAQALGLVHKVIVRTGKKKKPW
jgi:ATP-dependent protease ClpP protease subunit